jgi:hypothetical protein
MLAEARDEETASGHCRFGAEGGKLNILVVDLTGAPKIAPSGPGIPGTESGAQDSPVEIC